MVLEIDWHDDLLCLQICGYLIGCAAAIQAAGKKPD
jgi:hypothetical protein